MCSSRQNYGKNMENTITEKCMIDRSSPVKCNIFPIILSDAVGNTVFLTFQCSFFVVHAMLCGKSNMCLRNPLVTLCVSDCSRCGAVRIWRSLAQPSPHFGPVRSLSLWWGAHFEMARATLSALWACQIALVVARCSFWDGLCNPLGTLGVSDRSRRGAVLILIHVDG